MSAIAIRTLHEATGMSEQEAGEVWAKMPDSPFRKLIQYEIEVAKVRSDAACSTAMLDQVLKQQGISQGLQQALGILARKDPHPSK